MRPPPADTDHRREPGSDSGELRLLVSAEGVVGSHRLGADTALRLGRGADNDVDVDHPSVSRRHAELFVDPLAVRDLGSSNGTVVRGRRIPPGVLVAIAVDEEIQLGSAALLVHRVASVEPAAGGAGDDFERLLSLTIAGACRTGAAFTVVDVRATSTATSAELAAAVATAGVPAVATRAGAGGDLQILLADHGGDGGRGAAVAVVAAVAAAGIDARVGVARWPEAGVSPEQLVARAWQLAAPTPAPATVMDGVRDRLAELADGRMPVLIHGEPGAGAELCAEVLHRMSARRTRPLITVRCAALGDGQLESELFGVERGAMAGPGLLERAAGGTVFFDDIADMPLAVQAKLTAVIDHGVVRRIGASEPRAIDVRLVAATSQLVERAVALGALRAELCTRLAAVSVELPPLRARRDEIEGLARAMVATLSHAARRPAPVLATDAIDALLDHPWPGNLRELRRTLDRALTRCSDGALRGHHLGLGAGSRSILVTLQPGDGPPTDAARGHRPPATRT